MVEFHGWDDRASVRGGGVMAGAARVLAAVSPHRLTGPVFAKELRVSARRRRSFALRFAYLFVLGCFVVAVWLSETGTGDRFGAYSIAQMASAGKTIVTSIVWFQFVALQGLAVVLASTSINEEVYRRTLAVLLTTPVTTFQIAAGKLLSRVLQLALLVAVSLPLLAIVRVFGGVPWRFVLASQCITVCACMLAGAAAMFFSTRIRRAYLAILATLGVAGFYYVSLGGVMIAMAMGAGRGPGGLALGLIAHVHPAASLVICTRDVLEPGSTGAGFLWPVNCAATLGLTLAILALCARQIRAAATRQAGPPARLFAPAGQWLVVRQPRSAAPGRGPVRPHPPLPTKQEREHPVSSPPPPPAQPPPPPSRLVVVGEAVTFRRVFGSPMIWREFRNSMWRYPDVVIAILVVGGFSLLGSYLISLEGLIEGWAHGGYGVAFILSGALATAVLAATRITPEREARTWPLILTTTLGDWHILLAKACGVARRTLPIWCLLPAHVLVFWCFRCIHPLAMLHVVILTAWVFAFVTSLGLYFGTRFRRTSTVVILTLTTCAVLWGAAPGLTGLLAGILGPEVMESGAVVFHANPLVQAFVLLQGAGGTEAAATGGLDYRWPGWQWGQRSGAGPGPTTILVLMCATAYGLVALLLLVRARRRLRQSAF